MVDNTRRQIIAGAGALLAGTAGCLGNDETDSDGDGVPDSSDYAPHDSEVQAKSDLQQSTPTEQDTETTEPYDEEPPADTDDSYTETTPGPNEPLTMEYLEQHSPAIADMQKHYNGSDGRHNFIVGSVNWAMDRFDYHEDVLAQSKESMTLYRDTEAEATGERYRAEIDILTDRFGPYADLSEHIENGSLEKGEQVRKEITYMLGDFVGSTLEEDLTPLGDLNVVQREEHQDAVSEIEYNLQGAKGGSLTVTLTNEGPQKDMSYVSNEVYGTDDWSEHKIGTLVDELLEV